MRWSETEFLSLPPDEILLWIAYFDLRDEEDLLAARRAEQKNRAFKRR